MSGVHRRLVGHMVPIEGDRDETCALYEECLGAHVMAHLNYRHREIEASCPRGCRWQEPRTERATDYMGKKNDE